MLGYSQSSNFKSPHKYGEDSMQNTACQTNFFNQSTKRTDFFATSPLDNRPTSKLKASIALSRAKTVVNSLMEEIQDKRNMNNDVLQQIFNTNMNTMEEVVAWNNVWSNCAMQEKRQPYQQPRRMSKKASIKQRIQTFESQPNEDGQNWVEVYGSGWNNKEVYDEWSNINCGEIIERPTTKIYKTESQIQKLKQIIMNQSQSNANLMKKCSQLQIQNKRLKSSNQNNQNFRLLMQQLDNIKRQNQLLRSDTIRLLKNIR